MSQVLTVGKTSLPIIVATISSSLLLAFLLQKWFKLDVNTATLVGVGSSICGGSAIAATAPVIQADGDEIAQSISVIFLFNILAALIFPTLGDMIGLSNHGFALLQEQQSMKLHPLLQQQQLGMDCIIRTHWMEQPLLN